MNERERVFVILATAAATENISLLQEQTVIAKGIGIPAVDIKEVISIANPSVTQTAISSRENSCCR